MSTHDALLEKWRAKLADETHESCMDAASLRPGSYCTVFAMSWAGPDSGTVSMLAPEYFDSPGDFVAFVRAVELPRSLDMQCHGKLKSGEPFPPAEAYLDTLDGESRPLAEAAIAAADAALAKAEITAADAEAVIAAFNELFAGDAEFVAAGDITAVFGTERITESFDAWSADAEDLLDAEEPEMIVKRLIDAGEFDPFDAAQLELVRGMLAGYPVS